MQNDQNPPCAVCKLVRIYIMLAIPMILIMSTQPEIARLKGISLTNAFSALIAFAFVFMIGWKYYHEIWKPRRESADKDGT